MAEMVAMAHEALRGLISAPENKELECREFLQYAKGALVRDTVIEFVYVEKERRGTSGDSDYIVSCKVCDETGVESVKAYIWELKAPQCYVFEKDTENRLRPTKELVQAENQLLHYYHEHKGCEQFKNDFGVTHSDNVLFGGIIIGCHARRTKGDYQEEKRNKLFEKALMIRKKYIYDPLHIRIIHWDYILDLLKHPMSPERNPVEAHEVLSQPLDPESIVVTSSP
ncbi:MAG: hypothetical protein KKD92_07365 [Proteobacteria bacterium]|nr:hypothetical protein [Pseudomonadota bacterium]